MSYSQYYNKIMTKYNQEKNQETRSDDDEKRRELLLLESLRTCAAIKYHLRFLNYANIICVKIE